MTVSAGGCRDRDLAFYERDLALVLHRLYDTANTDHADDRSHEETTSRAVVLQSRSQLAEQLVTATSFIVIAHYKRFEWRVWMKLAIEIVSVWLVVSLPLGILFGRAMAAERLLMTRSAD